MCPFLASDKGRFRPRSFQMNAREREHFGGMMDRHHRVVCWYPQRTRCVRGTSAPDGTGTLLAEGLATGILEGIARRPAAELGWRGGGDAGRQSEAHDANRSFVHAEPDW
jgi:hypothetical protein